MYFSLLARYSLFLFLSVSCPFAAAILLVEFSPLELGLELDFDLPFFLLLDFTSMSSLEKDLQFSLAIVLRAQKLEKLEQVFFVVFKIEKTIRLYRCIFQYSSCFLSSLELALAHMQIVYL